MELSPALTTLFNNIVENNAPFYVARLYTIVTAGNGPVLRFTDADFNILALSTSPAPAPVNGFTYRSDLVRVDQNNSKTQCHWKIGLDVDAYTLVLMPRPFDPVTGAAFPDTIGNIPFLQACHAGALDAADFQVDEAWFSALPTWPMPPAGVQPLDCKTIFAGKLGPVDATSVAVLTVNDYRDLLSISMPKHFYQGQCRHTLFDVNCNADGNMNAAAFAIAGTVSAGSTQSTILSNGLAVPGGSKTYALGRLQMTSGKCAGSWRLITGWDGQFTLSLIQPLPYPVTAGDQFTVYPGCNKLRSTCRLFNNINNFGGMPYIPPPETALGA